MDEPIFRPVGKTIVQVMDSFGPKIQNIAQSGWVHFLDSHNPTFKFLGPRKMADRLFFAITGTSSPRKEAPRDSFLVASPQDSQLVSLGASKCPLNGS